jgi:hypothetical protein
MQLRPSALVLLLAAAHDHDAGSGSDQRQVIRLTPAEKHFLLSEMRGFVAITQKIISAATANDMAAVAEAARVGGLKAHQKDFANPDSLVHGIRKKAPQAFFPLGRETHINFDRIAELATELKDRDVVLNTLADNLNNCIACHSAYRVEEAR